MLFAITQIPVPRPWPVIIGSEEMTSCSFEEWANQLLQGNQDLPWLPTNKWDSVSWLLILSGLLSPPWPSDWSFSHPLLLTRAVSLAGHLLSYQECPPFLPSSSLPNLSRVQCPEPPHAPIVLVLTSLYCSSASAIYPCECVQLPPTHPTPSERGQGLSSLQFPSPAH